MVNKIISVLLFVIAASLASISWKIYQIPTYGEMVTIRKIENPEQRKAAFESFFAKIPISDVRRIMGTVDVNVENAVRVEADR